MTVRNTKGLEIWLENGNTAPLGIVPTAISASAPAVITVPDVAGLDNGDVITFYDTGFEELDGKTFIIANLDGGANTFEALGSDTTNTVGSLGPTPGALVTKQDDMTPICAASLTIDNAEPGTVSVGTFCDPSASIPSVVVEPGNLSLTVYHDTTSEAFRLLESAALDGNERLLVIEFPGDGGYLIARGVISSFAITDAPLDGAVQWTATFALASRPVLRYAA